MHLDADLVEKLLHGDLDPEQEAEARVHAESCTACAEAISRATAEEDRILDLLRVLDLTPPTIDVRTVVSRASRPWLGSWRRVAAAVALTLLSGSALYALPGSPVRSLIRGIIQRSERTPQLPAAEAGPPAGQSVDAAIAFDIPASFSVVFDPIPEGGSARIEIVDDSELSVRATKGPITFDARRDRLFVRIGTGGTPEFEVRIPRSASHVEVLYGPTLLLRKTDSGVATSATRDTTGGYVLRLAPSTGSS
jgi:hypothetical protein